ncbi:MAG TPA: GNAT family N-acetyltransferase [Bacteroidia bacterium]|nr:GNAT family N-acetyltransferase [Bacteroidia bacterium]
MNLSELIWRTKKFDELTLDQLYAILKLRMEVFIVEQNCFYLDLDDVDKVCLHLYATDSADNIAAYARAIPQGAVYKSSSFGRVVVHPQWRGTGLGKLLTKNVMEVIENNFGTTEIKISAQSHLEKFYVSFGFVKCGDEYMDAGILHIPMTILRF